ncbi:hypothetical protein ACFQV2_11280 [Actinokineospora soli]|uniref:Uncharacterized protein n=1 Tax=Actinokineospora soli TaxID=1048753 RepID=A0ABW2TND4_9PSEU
MDAGEQGGDGDALGGAVGAEGGGGGEVAVAAREGGQARGEEVGDVAAGLGGGEAGHLGGGRAGGVDQLVDQAVVGGERGQDLGHGHRRPPCRSGTTAAPGVGGEALPRSGADLVSWWLLQSNQRESP